MKNVFFILAVAMGMTMSAQTQKKSIAVPATVATAFAKAFPGANATWSDEDGNFEAEFQKNGKENSVVYDRNGRQKLYEVQIQQTELPEAASKYLANNFANYKIVACSKVKNDQNVVTYEAEITGIDGIEDVIFDQKGMFVKKIKSDKN